MENNKKDLVEICNKLNGYINNHQEEFLSQGEYIDISFSASDSKNEIYLIAEKGSSKINCDYAKLKNAVDNKLSKALIIDIYKNDGEDLNNILDIHLK
jgi:hypothetical protein